MSKRKAPMAKKKMANKNPNGGCGLGDSHDPTLPIPGPTKPLRCDTQAFPRPATSRDMGCNGMTLRDYFAAQALIGILGSRNGFLIDVGTENAPGWAYQVADKMLEARK